MKYLKKILIFIALAVFVVLLHNVFTNNRTQLMLFFFPGLALSFFLGYYLYKQSEKGDTERLVKQLRNVAEDMKAEKWIKESLAPDTLTVIKLNRWIIIIFSFVFILVVTFLWSYLTHGALQAMRDFAYVGVLFWSFIMYVLLFPSLFEFIEKPLPKKIKRLFENDWIRGYIFLLPITYFMYLMFPYDAIFTDLENKLTSFQLFFLVYSSIFLGSFSMTYIYEDAKREEEEHMRIEVKKSLLDEQKK